jgi:hypothetical protein
MRLLWETMLWRWLAPHTRAAFGAGMDLPDVLRDSSGAGPAITVRRAFAAADRAARLRDAGKLLDAVAVVGESASDRGPE